MPTQTKEEYDFFNPPLTFKIVKNIKTDGDAKLCPICNARTMYVTGCIVCGKSCIGA